MTWWYRITIFMGILLLFTSQSEAQEKTPYIDVHVHLRGTATSAMLGDSGNQKQVDRPMRKQGPRPGMRPGFPGRPDRRNLPQQAAQPSQEKNLETAAGNLISKMDEQGVQQALVVVVPGPISNEQEEKTLLQVVRKYPERLKLMAGGALLSPYLQDIAPKDVTEADRAKFRQAATGLLRDGAAGFGEMISYHLSMANHHSFQYAPPDHPLYLLLADIAAEHDVAIDLHMEAIVSRRPIPQNLKRASGKNPEMLQPTIPAFERLLAHNPKARIVWQHIGWDNTGDMTSGLLDRLLSSHPNLFIALRVENRLRQVGGGSMMPNRLVDEKGRLKPEWSALITRFSDRITIGTDEFFFPVKADQTDRPNQSFHSTWALLKQLSPEIRQKIGGLNAKRIYSLK